MSEDSKHIIALTGTVGELKGEMKALVSGFENFAKEMRGANSEQWETMTKNKDECVTRVQKVTKSLTDYKTANATKTVITGGGAGGSLMLVWEILKHYLKGGG